MKWETDIVSNSTSLMMDESLKSTIWNPVENKLFENALAKFDNDTPDRWQRVAEMVPGKTVADVIRQYKELEDDVSSIEAGLSPKYRYNHNINNNSPFTLEWGDGHECKSPPYGGGGTLSPVAVVAAGRPVEQERKKGVPWTEEEHKLFLLGLKKYGKGDWRNISRNYVVTRTPTQVASHAQKYFLRQASLDKKNRRSSLFDLVRDKNGLQNQIMKCNMSRTSSFDDEYDEDHNDNNLSLIDFGSLKQEKGSYFNPMIKSYETSSSPTCYASPSATLDLELTLAAPNPMDQNKSSTTSLQLGPIISVV